MHGNLYELGILSLRLSQLELLHFSLGQGASTYIVTPAQPANSSFLTSAGEIWLLMAIFLCRATTEPTCPSTRRVYFWIDHWKEKRTCGTRAWRDLNYTIPYNQVTVMVLTWATVSLYKIISFCHVGFYLWTKKPQNPSHFCSKQHLPGRAHLC